MKMWKVSHNVGGGISAYYVYRTKRENEPDHSGNRDYITIPFENEEIAQKVADAMNMVTEEAFGND